MTTPRKPTGRYTPPKAQLSRDSLELFATLLAQVTISPTADDFEEVAAKMGKARRELIAALGAPKAIVALPPDLD
jgi:hypothetical protein